MKACTLVVTPLPGVTTVTGVVDQSGTPFVGKAFLFHGNSERDSLRTPFQQSYGLDVLTARCGQASGANNAFNLKTICTGTGGNASVHDEIATFFFGGTTGLLAHVSAVRSGEFDLFTFYSVRAGHSYLVTVLGGDDLLVDLREVQGSGSNPTITVGFAPEVLIFQHQILFGGTDSNGGGCQMAYGWATRQSGKGAATTEIQGGPGGNTRYLSTTHAIARVSGAGLHETRDVLAWNPTSYQVDGSASSATAGLALGGLHAAAGSLLQPAGTGLQEVVTGLDNRVVLLLSVGGVSSPGVQASPGLWVVGMLDGTRQGGIWTGEGLIGDGVLTGARYLSTADVLRFATPSAGSTSFTARAVSAGFSVANRSFSLDWQAVDGVAREVLWLALGDPPPASDLHLSCPTVTSVVVNTPYADTLTASGGVPPYTFSIVAGALPTGLTLNAATGAIAGTPTVIGAFPFSPRVTDDDGTTTDIDCEIDVTDTCPRPIIGSGGEGAALVVVVLPAPDAPGSCTGTPDLLLETGDYLLLETSGHILIETTDSIVPTIGSAG